LYGKKGIGGGRKKQKTQTKTIGKKERKKKTHSKKTQAYKIQGSRI
jgi:hypothetical protein